MDTLLLAFLLLGAASAATLLWLMRAPVGHEDTEGFHSHHD